MKALLLFLCLVAPSLGRRLPYREGPLPYILGGHDVEKAGTWPWQGSLRNWLGNHKCGCVLASTNWVITAAHCVGGSIGSMSVILGAHDIKTLQEGEPITYKIKEKRVHTGFKNDASLGFPNDIALLRLSTPAKVDSPYISPVDLAREEDGDFSGWNRTCYITGWGDDGGWFLPNILQEARILALHNDFCREIFGERIGPGHVCVTYNNEANSCGGDSGGPFVCKVGETWQLVGVTSWGRAYCTPFPSVYTRITHYRKWLTDNSDGEL